MGKGMKAGKRPKPPGMGGAGAAKTCKSKCSKFRRCKEKWMSYRVK